MILRVEEKIKERAHEYLSKARPGDWDHTLRVVALGRRLVRMEKGDGGFIIPALYLHDVGWSRTRVEEFADTPFYEQEASQSALLHQKAGYELARSILEELRFDVEMIDRICDYIRIHDQPDKILALEDRDAILCFEADRLDRFGRHGRKRLDEIFGDFHSAEREAFLREGAAQWFRTPSALEILEYLLSES